MVFRCTCRNDRAREADSPGFSCESEQLHSVARRRLLACVFGRLRRRVRGGDSGERARSMRRRDFLILLGSAAAILPLPGSAQPSSAVRRVGWIGYGTEADGRLFLEAFLSGMGEH